LQTQRLTVGGGGIHHTRHRLTCKKATKDLVFRGAYALWVGGCGGGSPPPLSGVRWVEQIPGRLSQGSISKRDIRPKLKGPRGRRRDGAKQADGLRTERSIQRTYPVGRTDGRIKRTVRQTDSQTDGLNGRTGRGTVNVQSVHYSDLRGRQAWQTDSITAGVFHEELPNRRIRGAAAYINI